MLKEWADLDATALADLVRKKEVTPGELVETAIDAVERVNPKLNAVVHRMYDRAREAAKGALPDGPFRGVPLVVKDLDGAVAGEPYTMSCRMLEKHVARSDDEIMVRLKRAGVVLFAKTNTPELGIVAYTEPELRGATRNPWNTDRTPCGSSGGSAALVAARAVPMAHGGDGGGSIRIPSSATGLFGLKPTRARNPVGPTHGEMWGGYVQPHVLTRSVRDSAAMLDATAGPEAGAPYELRAPARPFAQEAATPPGKLRIAVSKGSLYGKSIHPDCVAAVEAAAKLCADLGHEVVEASPSFDREEMVRAYFVQVCATVAATIEDVAKLAGRKPSIAYYEAPTWLIGQIGKSLSAVDLEKSRAACQKLGRSLASFFETHDLFLDATLADLPVKIGELALKPGEKALLAFLRAFPSKMLFEKVMAELGGKNLERTPNTMIFNQTGNPAMNVPLHWNADGMPVGVQFAARFGDEATLFRLAAQLEQARPWASRKPPVCA
jgi:amidase